EAAAGDVAVVDAGLLAELRRQLGVEADAVRPQPVDGRAGLAEVRGRQDAGAGPGGLPADLAALRQRHRRPFAGQVPRRRQAEDTQLGRPVALKVILPEFAAEPAARERFLREARACAALKDDHVVTIYQVGEDRGVPFLAMELLRGESLEERLRRAGPLPIPE